MYQPSIRFERTPEQYTNPELAWDRSDIAFFGAGACHILAYAFMQLHPHENFEIIHIRPVQTTDGHHVYVSDGLWAFDHNGWTREHVLLHANQEAERAHNPQWQYDRVVIETSISDFCVEQDHMIPEDFPHAPWERAYAYIQQFAQKPPSDL